VVWSWNMEQVVIMVVSCDRYSDVWSPFFKLFKKYWPDCPYRVFFVTNNLDPAEPGVTTIRTGDDTTWATQLLRALDQIKSPYVIMLLDDYFLRSTVPTDKVRRLVETGINMKVHCLRLMPRPAPTRRMPGYPELGILQPGDSYRVSTQAGLWRVETLRALIRPDQSGWEFEAQGTERSAEFKDGFLGVYKPAIDYVQGIVQGKWYFSGLAVCRKSGIDVDKSRRPVMPKWQLLKRIWTYSVIMRLKYELHLFMRRFRPDPSEPDRSILTRIWRMVAVGFWRLIQCCEFIICPLMNKLRPRSNMPALPPGNLKEDDLQHELRMRFRGFAAAEDRDSPKANTEWEGNTRRLTELVLSSDARTFLGWDVIQNTMFYGQTPLYVMMAEYGHLCRRPDWKERWSKAITESSMGAAFPFPLFPKSSATLVHHAYHLARFEGEAAITIGSLDTILEFGGGFGSMCRLCHNLGFKGKYIILDLPHFSALQQYYLKSCGLNVLPGTDFEKADEGIACLSSIDDLKHLFRTVNSKIPASLFIATWSLSEAPVETRDAVFDVVQFFSNYLICYRKQFGGVDNIRYFRDFRERISSADADVWHNKEILHIPRNYYLIGTRPDKC